MTEPMIHPRTAITSGPLSGVSVSRADALAGWREGAGAYRRNAATSGVMFISSLSNQIINHVSFPHFFKTLPFA
jgi:hypothetical protein